jgi:hypothetical protein
MKTCAAAGCANPVPVGTRGRPAIYCSAACRPSGQRRPGIAVELDHPTESPDGRPPERVWAVRLRRGQHIVVIADGLGWPTATALAQQLQDLLAPRRQRPSTPHELT